MTTPRPAPIVIAPLPEGMSPYIPPARTSDATLANVLTSDEMWTVLWALRDYQVQHLRHGVQCRRYEAEGGMPPKYGTESWAAAAERAEAEVIQINAVVAKFPDWMGETFRRAVAEEMAR